MGWLAALLLIALVLFWLWRLAGFRGPRFEWLGAALLVGLAGYAWQGSPALPGQPTVERDDRPPETQSEAEAHFIEAEFGPAKQWIDFARSLNRVGNHLGAAQAARKAVEAEPGSADAWAALGYALLLHGDGRMSPAASLAFERAARLDPDHPAPRFFSGLALAQQGQLEEADALWTPLLASAPEDAPYRAEVAGYLAEIRQALGRPMTMPEPGD